MHVISLPMIFIFLSYERKEASVGVNIVASSTVGTVVFFKKRNSTKSWWFLRPSNFKVGSGPVIWRLISHCYCGATTWVTLPWSSACTACGPGWSTSHMLANGSILFNMEDEQRVFIVYFWWKLLSPLLRRRSVKHGSPVNLACAPLPPSSSNAQVIAFSHFLSIYFLSNVFYLSFFKTQLFLCLF